MIEDINKNREPLINGEEGKKGMSIILAGYKSRKTGLPVKFPLEKFSTLEMEGIYKYKVLIFQSRFST